MLLLGTATSYLDAQFPRVRRQIDQLELVVLELLRYTLEVALALRRLQETSQFVVSRAGIWLDSDQRLLYLCAR